MILLIGILPLSWAQANSCKKLLLNRSQDALVAASINSVYGQALGERVTSAARALVAATRARVRERAGPKSLPVGQRPFDNVGVTLTTYADQFHGGANTSTASNLKRILQHFPFFRTRHFLPFFEGDRDGGFSVIDFQKVRRGIGSWSEMRALSTHGATGWFDLVLNHVDVKHRWFEGFRKGIRKYQSYFIEVAGEPQNVFHPRSTPYLRRVTTANGEKTVWMTFSESQADLNFKNPEVFLEQLKNMLFYYEVGGAKIFRIDAAPYAWKNIEAGGMPTGPYSNVHQRQIFDLLKAYKELLRELDPEIAVVPENHFPWKENAPYLEHVDAVYDFTTAGLILNSFATGDGTALKRALNQKLPKDTTKINFLGNHDGTSLNGLRGVLAPRAVQRLLGHLRGIAEKSGQPLPFGEAIIDGNKVPYEVCLTVRDLYASGSNVKENIQALAAAHHLLYSLQGVPQIYWPQIFAQRTDFSAIQKTGHRRDGNRPKYNAQEIESQIILPVNEALPMNELGKREWTMERIIRELEARGLMNASSELAEGRLMYAVFSRLSRIYEELSSRGMGPYDGQRFLKTDRSTVAIWRGDRKERGVLSVTSLSQRPTVVSLELSGPAREVKQWEDRLTGKVVSPVDGILKIELDSYGTSWLVPLNP